ncbi:hypothetical protein BY996DRAFT_6408812 [Phakopsora pachyrhizi]|nr:hypothetical protein BY996DRAFT_6408812 [Phakopsora pachyrhizi]
MVGGTIDKLIRHQPSLKKTVLEANVNFLNGIYKIGKNIDPSSKSLSRVLLRSEIKETKKSKEVLDFLAAPQSDLVNANNVLMSEPASGPADLLLQSTLDAVNKKEMDKKDAFLNRAVLLYVDVDCRLLESMLQNVAHSQYLTSMQGFDIKLSLLRLPSIPYNFLTTTAAKASASTIRLLTKTLPPQKFEECNLIFCRLISIPAYISLIEFLASDLTRAEYNNCNNKDLELGLGFLNDASP